MVAMTPQVQAIIAAAVSSLLGLLGGAVLLANHQGIQRTAKYLVSFAAGAMLGAAFFDVLPEALEEFPEQTHSVFFWLVLGFVFFLIIEKLLVWHHHNHADHDVVHDVSTKTLIPLVIIGDAIHNFIDGTIIAAAFLIDPALGVTAAIAVLAHELPQEIGDFAILLHSGMRKKAIALWNIFGALVSPLGAAVVLLLSGVIDGIELPMLGIAAGMFIYIAAADLVPEIHKEKSARGTVIHLAWLIGGLIVIELAGRLFPHSH